MMDKVVVLARGLGTRMRREMAGVTLSAEQVAAAESGMKALMPIERPFLDYVLTNVADAGYSRVCLVVGPEHGDVVEYYRNGVTCERLSIEFAVQAKPLGTADAVCAAEGFVWGDPFVMINCDNCYPVEALMSLRMLEGPGTVAFDRKAMFVNSNIPPERITSFALMEVDYDGYLKAVIEKPGRELIEGTGGRVGISMNCWRFDRQIFQACRSIRVSARGEFEIPDAVQYAMGVMGQRFKVVACDGAVLDLSNRADVKGVSELLRGKEVRL